MKITIMCSNYGNTKKINNTVAETVTVIKSGWGSCGSALYCPECSKTWSDRNVDRQMESEKNTFMVITDLILKAKGGTKNE